MSNNPCLHLERLDQQFALSIGFICPLVHRLNLQLIFSSASSDRRGIYTWADDIYFNIRNEGDRQCILVMIGVTETGHKELLALETGVRESELTWKQMLLHLVDQGLPNALELAIGDGALGFWKALSQVFPSTRHQRC